MDTIDYFIDFETEDKNDVEKRFNQIVHIMEKKHPDIIWTSGVQLSEYSPVLRYLGPNSQNRKLLIQYSHTKSIQTYFPNMEIVSYKTLIASEKLAII